MKKGNQYKAPKGEKKTGSRPQPGGRAQKGPSPRNQTNKEGGREALPCERENPYKPKKRAGGREWVPPVAQRGNHLPGETSRRVRAPVRASAEELQSARRSIFSLVSSMSKFDQERRRSAAHSYIPRVEPEVNGVEVSIIRRHSSLERGLSKGRASRSAWRRLASISCRSSSTS